MQFPEGLENTPLKTSKSHAEINWPLDKKMKVQIEKVQFDPIGGICLHCINPRYRVVSIKFRYFEKATEIFSFWWPSQIIRPLKAHICILDMNNDEYEVSSRLGTYLDGDPKPSKWKLTKMQMWDTYFCYGDLRLVVLMYFSVIGLGNVFLLHI